MYVWVVAEAFFCPVQMPVDHFGNTTGTFKNRYWINATYYKSAGPVFRASNIDSLHSFLKSIDMIYKQFLILANKMRSLSYPTTCKCALIAAQAPLDWYWHKLERCQEYHGLSATMQMAKRYNGVAILWEHRYYGDSLPFPVNVCLHPLSGPT